MKLKQSLALIVCLVVTMVSVPKVFASEIDILVNKLVQKGILTRGDANEILQETRIEAERESSMASGAVPTWVEKVKLKGDFRLRYETKKRKASQNVTRGRIRYRLGIEAKIVDQVKVAAGLATGGDSATSARSTNVDLQDAFSTKAINLDYAYVEYKPYEWTSIVGGKFKRKAYLWEPGDLLWDTDITPEGGSMQLKADLTDYAKGFINTGLWIVDESSTDTSDPHLFYVQPGITLKSESLNADAKLAFTYYDFSNVKNATINGSSGTNTTDLGPVGGGLTYDFNPIAVGAEVGFNEPFGFDVIPRVSLFGEYVQNDDPKDENKGWLLGFKIGDKKVKKANQWQLKYMYARLQKDAFIDAFPDADRYGGATDVLSHEGVVQYGLNKNVMVELDYYHTRRYKASDVPENIVQASANFKF